MHTVKFVADKEYFSEMFSQSLRYTNKWRKFERILGPIFLCLGTYMLVTTHGEFLSPFVLIGIGGYEILNPFIKKPIWIRRQLKSKLANSDIEITFSEEGFESCAPNIKSSMKWEGVERIAETPKGIFIWPQKGVHMYVPRSAAGSDLIEFIKRFKREPGRDQAALEL